MIILGIETSTRVGSVALAAGGKILGERELPPGGRHSTSLVPAIDSLLGGCGVDRASVGGISVGIGPGSFTGIRMGLATGRGLAFALDIPLRGISGMDLLVEARGGERARLAPVVNAHSYGLYAALYERREGNLVRVREPFVCRPEELAERISGSVFFLGPDLERFRGPLLRAFGERASFDKGDAFPRAADAALLYGSPHAVAGDDVTPLYILPGVRKKMPPR